MALISWSESYSVNSPLLDQQHQKLFALINDLYDNLRQGKGDDALGKTLDALIGYARVHFVEEEALMTKYHYPGLAHHQDQHDHFVRTVFELQNDYRDGRLDLALPVLEFLKDWLSNHILKEDKAYAVYIQQVSGFEGW